MRMGRDCMTGYGEGQQVKQSVLAGDDERIVKQEKG